MSNSLNGFRDNVNNGNPDFGYDAYGNMTSDANKRIEDIDYNHLNLPTVINFQDNGGRIRYTYDALGVKVRKEVDDLANGTTTTDYLDGFQYKSGALQFFPTSEGYVEFKEPNRLFYVYNYTDHLGNVRMSYTDNGVAVPKILEENHYYPFGLKHENYASERFEFIKEPHGTLYVIQPTERREWQYKYNGKEWQDELGLNFYDYGARNYDAAIGRWMNVDPLAEKFCQFSPYSYVLNNPILFIDPNGKDVFVYYIGPRRRWYNKLFYTLNGHTALGARPYGYKYTTYANLSGSALRSFAPEDYVKEYGMSRYIDESATINDYINNGDVVIKMRLQLDKKVEEIISTYIAAEASNGRDQGGLFCTGRAQRILLVSLIEAGYSEEDAEAIVDKLIWYNTPEFPTAEEMLDADFLGADYYFLGGSDGKQRVHLNFDFNNRLGSWKEGVEDRKREGLHNLLSNFQNLSSGTYRWNGDSWVKD
ncbi:RHS repeat-associated core domain-containing protein [Flavobacterium sp.]|uniref:RHS repeat domain-containing protein n=1 Tax=Flavobacterium sp. TaxID=239 RepID=UPI00261503B2|nr:RHS repeat-associated core domain-containing protein [Flavobacterium sp.]